METTVFDGREFARQREIVLKHQLEERDTPLKITTIVFKEDPAGVKYTHLKKSTAERLGIAFVPQYVSIKKPLPELIMLIQKSNQDPINSGIMIQKPAQLIWRKYGKTDTSMKSWWQALVEVLDPSKDVDCLCPDNLDKVRTGTWKILPATAQAVITILEEARALLHQPSLGNEHLTAVVIGRSDIVGLPTAEVLKQQGYQTHLYGSDLDYQVLKHADIVVSATGQQDLISGHMIKPGAILIDVGAPCPDIDTQSVIGKARFVTPVPGGVGPVTVISLMENLVRLASSD